MVKRMVAEHTVLYVVISVCTLGDQCISLQIAFTVWTSSF